MLCQVPENLFKGLGFLEKFNDHPVCVLDGFIYGFPQVFFRTAESFYFPVDGDNKKFGIILGDVSGKAMKAAVTAIMTSGMIISEIRSGKCISKILESLNSTLMKMSMY